MMKESQTSSDSSISSKRPREWSLRPVWRPVPWPCAPGWYKSMSQEAIAAVIEAHIDRLIETWIAAVRDDTRIQSDAMLSKPELIDHVPAIVHQICELIRKNETPD